MGSPTSSTRPSPKCPVTETPRSVLELSLTSYLPRFFVYFLYNSHLRCNFYFISANHTNVQLSPKQQYVKFLHFLSSAVEINTWQSYLFWYLHHHNFNQL